MIKVRMTRDSVCAGYDADAPHERVVEIESPEADLAPVMQFIRATATGYLPSVNGVGHCWSAFLNGKFIATVTVTGGWPCVDELNLEPENELHFKYHSARY